MRLNTIDKVNLGFGLALVVVVLIGVVSYRAMARSMTTAASVAQTHEVIASLQRVQSLLHAAESAQRAFIIAGQETHRARYQDADTLVTRTLRRLRDLRLADPDQTVRLARLGDMTARRLALVREGIALREAHGTDAALPLLMPGRGSMVMDSVIALAGSMERRERILLDARNEELATRARSAQLVVGSGTLFAFLLVLTATLLMRRDVARRFRVESALRESEAVLSQFMESLPVGTYVIDAAGRPRFANNAARTLLGRGIQPEARPERHSEIYGIRRAGTDIPYPSAELPLVQALAGFRSSIDDAEMHTPDGVVPVAISAAPIFDASGHVAYAIAALDDITERRRTEAALRAAKESAETASRTKSDFLARMSHELRTPLNSVIGFANILLKNRAGNLSARDVTYLQRIEENGRHLLMLINAVLDLSKIEAGRIDLEFESFSLTELVDEVVRQWDGQLAPGLVLQTELPGGLAPLDSDRARLKQVLINLVGNAVKFTARGAVSVVVEAEAYAPRRLHVRDTGIGIAPDRLEAIFGTFEQAESSIAKRFGGTGLGLPISRRLCELLGFTLDVASEPGVGSTFTIDLAPRPRAERPAPSGMAGAQEPA